MNDLIKFGAKKIISGKVNAMEKKFEEFVQLSKLNELLKKEQRKAATPKKTTTAKKTATRTRKTKKTEE